MAERAVEMVTLQHDGFDGIGTADWRKTKHAYQRGADALGRLQRLAESGGARGFTTPRGG